MFDELDNKNSAIGGGVRPVGPAPVKPEDIFSEVDKTVKPEAFRPGHNNSLPVSGTVIPADDGWLKNKMIIFGLIFGGLIIVLGGGYLGLRLMVKNPTPANTEVVKEEATPTPEVVAPAVEENTNVVEPLIQPIVTQSIDSDQDGLTDEEEATLSTNPNNADTDGDGLTDREEVKVYSTDPLKADTDGDGYSDGEEVKNGFNPKGSGKLLDINNQK